MKYRITDYLGQTELLAMCAEECAELAQAALKLRRVIDGRNPTPVSFDQAIADLNEEIADVTLCIDQIAYADGDTIERIRKKKKARWIYRLMTKAKKDRDARKGVKFGRGGAFDGELPVYHGLPFHATAAKIPGENDEL